MFNFFRIRKKDKTPLQNWSIPIDDSFRKIVNRDSIQFANPNGSRVLYFSLLRVTGKELFVADASAKKRITVTREHGSWQLKGIRQGGNELLVCAFTYTNEGDEAWMKNLFESIEYTAGNSKE